ncbi:hypothetical protein [Crocosphaera subtropica]|uniref:hypothetical protein n=1 Tax=Crocosphaera subtropica TaxID=2546360 RepID=UPI0002314E26|nr:hypothetical protein [Crocosphaera subtropica]
MTRYGFEIKEISISELIETWIASYSVYWIRLAIVEALYQGRYKAISVEHILALWKRLGHPTYHFTYEFERFITRNLFFEEVNNHQKREEEQPEEQSLTPEESVKTVPKNSISLTPIQELVKKIAIPISIASEKLNSKTNPKAFLNDVVSEKVEQPNLAIAQKELESPTPSDQGKTPSTINQFVPHSDSSDFYGKLRAVAYKQLEEDQDN